jgi:hypothetical protein
MALASFHFLTAVIPADAAHASGLDRLAVDDPSTGLRITAQPYTETLAQDGVKALPGPIQLPGANIVIHCLPGRPLLRQEAPGPAAAHDVEDRVQNRTQRVNPGTSCRRRRRQERSDKLPFRTGQIARIQG